MTQPYATGGVCCYAGVGAGSAPVVLGWARDCPRIQHRPQYKGVMSDPGGQSIPSDVAYEGRDALVTLTLTRFNWNTLFAIQERYSAGVVFGTGGLGPIGGIGALTVPGFDPPGSIGALLQLEGGMFPLWLPFPFSAKPAYRNAVNGAMPVGRRYVQCVCMNDDWDSLGTQAQEISLVFWALRQPVVSAGGIGWILYDTNMSGLPSPN